MAIAFGADRRAPAGLRAAAAHARRSHPEWWVYALAAGAWVVLAVAPGEHAGPLGEGGLHVGAPLDAAAVPGLAAAAVLMTLAMMAPMAAPAARYVSLAGRADRRVRGPAVFLASFVAAWSGVGLALMVVIGIAAAVVGPLTTLIVVSAAAVAWHRSMRRRRTLSRCASHEPMGGRGRRADVAAARFGLRSARACMVTCGGLMTVAIAAGHPLMGVAALLAVQVHDRTQRWPDPRIGSGVVVGVAALVLITGLGPLAATVAGGSGDPVVAFVCRVAGVSSSG